MSRARPFRQHPHGLTAIELVVALAITAILLTMASIPLADWRERQRVRSAAAALHHEWLGARNQAVFTGVPTVACPGDPIAGCLDLPLWDGPRLVFADLNGDRAFQPGENILRLGEPLSGVRATGTHGRTHVRFTPTGAAPGTNARVAVCDRLGGDTARLVVVANTGRVMVRTSDETTPCTTP